MTRHTLPPDGAGPLRWFELTLIPGLLLSLFFLSAWLIPLCGDEAYYWLWATRPEWGYCDHPPAVAWLGHILQMAGCVNVAFFRIPGSLAYLAAVLMIAQVARDALREKPEQGAVAFRWTVTIAVVSPLLAHYATEMGPDSPLLLAWSLGCWSAYRALITSSGNGALPYWSIFGAATALAVYSKLTGWLLPCCLLGYVVTCQRNFSRKGLGLAVLTGLLLLTPHLVWNYLNEGRNYLFQWTLRRQNMGWQATNLLKPMEILADQGLLSLFTLAALVWALRRPRQAPPVVNLLLWFSLPLQVFFFVFRLLGVGRWNWPLSSYLPLSALLALWLVETGHYRRPYFRLAVWATALWTLGALTLRTFPPLQEGFSQILSLGHISARVNELPLAYPEIGARMRTAAEEGLFLINDDYTEAAALSYYSGHFVRVVSPFQEGSQFLVWNHYEDLLGEDALLVCHRPLGELPQVFNPLRESFTSFEELPVWQVEGLPTVAFYPVRCHKLIMNLLQDPHPPFFAPGVVGGPVRR